MQNHIKPPEITVKDGYITCRNVDGTLKAVKTFLLVNQLTGKKKSQLYLCGRFSPLS